MFAYSDPTGTGFLEQQGALELYREGIHEEYIRGGTLSNSAFTRIEAFEELTPGVTPETARVLWPAFPITAAADELQIDDDRLRFQDEYVEWLAERDAPGNLVRITFVTEFPEYFEALAMVGVEALKEEIANINPGADPKTTELFGTSFDPANASPRTRALQFRQFLRFNPWNNGEKGILCLTQRFNTLGALITLLSQCSVPQPQIDPGQVCAFVGGACGQRRNSDPRISVAVQNLALRDDVLSAADPIGIFLHSLAGDWTLGGSQFDINDPAQNNGVWTVSRNARRAVLTVTPELRLDGAVIRTGAQVSAQLQAASAVLAAPGAAAPDWARTGNEQRLIS